MSLTSLLKIFNNNTKPKNIFKTYIFGIATIMLKFKQTFSHKKKIHQKNRPKQKKINQISSTCNPFTIETKFLKKITKKKNLSSTPLKILTNKTNPKNIFKMYIFELAPIMLQFKQKCSQKNKKVVHRHRYENPD